MRTRLIHVIMKYKIYNSVGLNVVNRRGGTADSISGKYNASKSTNT
ncbi:hypothetical protein [Formosa sediminum]|nr:hypothetical protein [Formosa sediminum]